MRRYLSVVVMLLSLLSVGSGPAALTDSDFARYRVLPQQIEGMTPHEVPELSARAALLLDGDSGAMLYGKNEHQRLPPASTTKMVTALVAVKEANLGDHVTVMPGDLAVGSAMGLSPGEELTLKELLYGLLLVSDNAVAEIIARHVAGSQTAFVALMNQWVADHGLKDTHFSDPHGIDAPDHFSSAYDLAVIAGELLRDPLLSAIVATKEQWAASRLLENTNELLGTYPGANGVKTGTTDAAGQCLVASVRRANGWALVVVLGSSDRYGDARTLCDYYFANYVRTVLGLEPSPFARIKDSEGQWRPLLVQDEVPVLLARWQEPYLRSFLRLEAENVARGFGGPVGRVSFSLLGRTISELPVYVGAY